MADLPDLATNEVSWIAYWNAIDNGGVAEIDPETALSNGNLQSYSLYDNGWEGQYQGTNRTFTVRIKTDGWIIAYMDRLDAYQTQAGSYNNIDGQYDIIDGWYSTIENNLLEQAIASLQGSLDSGLNYTASQVGLYNYDFTSTNITVLRATHGNDAYHGFLLNDLSVVYAAALGRANSNSAFGSYRNATVRWQGTTIASEGGGGNDYGSIDILPDLTSMQVEYLGEIDTYSNAEQSKGYLTVIILWDPV